MMKIRSGMFETNSSSTHTIVVTDSKTEPGVLVDFKIGEFGWEHRMLCDIDDKASYLYTMACDQLGRDVYQDLYEILSKYGIKCLCSKPAQFNKKHGYLEYGYVDHCTDGDAVKFVNRMLAHEHALIKFLFSDESFVITGNDNLSCEDDDPFRDVERNLTYSHKTYFKGN